MMKFDKPPTDCKLVLDMVMIIFGKEANLEQEKHAMSDPVKFLESIKTYDMRKVSKLM